MFWPSSLRCCCLSRSFLWALTTFPARKERTRGWVTSTRPHFSGRSRWCFSRTLVLGHGPHLGIGPVGLRRAPCTTPLPTSPSSEVPYVVGTSLLVESLHARSCLLSFISFLCGDWWRASLLLLASLFALWLWVVLGLLPLQLLVVRPFCRGHQHGWTCPSSLFCLLISDLSEVCSFESFGCVLFSAPLYMSWLRQVHRRSVSVAAPLCGCSVLSPCLLFSKFGRGGGGPSSVYSSLTFDLLPAHFRHPPPKKNMSIFFFWSRPPVRGERLFDPKPQTLNPKPRLTLSYWTPVGVPIHYAFFPSFFPLFHTFPTVVHTFFFFFFHLCSTFVLLFSTVFLFLSPFSFSFSLSFLSPLSLLFFFFSLTPPPLPFL